MTIYESGAYVSDSGLQYAYVRVDVTTSLTPTALNYTIKVNIRTTGSVSDSYNSWAIKTGGTTRASGTNVAVNHGYSGGTTYMGQYSGSLPRLYGSTNSVSWDALLGGFEIYNNLGTKSGTLSVAARDYSVPRPPPSISVTRESDTKHVISWTTDYDSSSEAQPWTGVYVERSTDDGAWQRVAPLPRSTTSWTDNGTSEDHKYEWRVQSYNSAGASTYVESADYFTTPAPPSGLTAQKQGTSVALAFTNNARTDTGIRVYDSPDGTTWTLVEAVTGANLTSYTDTDPATSQTYYAVSATRGSLESAQSPASNPVTVLQAPAAPTILSPSDGAPIALEDGTTGTFQHNPLDTTDQTAYEVYWWRSDTPGTVYTTNTVLSGAGTHAFAAADTPTAGLWVWKVRTKGDHVDWSPWSPTSTFYKSARPTVVFDTTDPSWGTSSTLTLVWNYYDPEGTTQSAWEATLATGGGVLESRSGSGSTGTMAFNRAVEDGVSYTPSLRVRDGDGVWSEWETSPLTIDYAPPPTPVVSLTYVPASASVLVDVINPTPGVGEVEAVRNDVYRALGGGWVLVGSAGPNSSMSDPVPPVGVDVDYRVVAVSANPSTAETVETITTGGAGTPAVMFNYGDGYATLVGLRGGVSLDHGDSVETVLDEYEGRTLPVPTTGELVTHEVTVSAMILPAWSTVPQVRALSGRLPVAVRDTRGGRWWVALGRVNVSEGPGRAPTMTVRCTEVENDG